MHTILRLLGNDERSVGRAVSEIKSLGASAPVAAEATAFAAAAVILTFAIGFAADIALRAAL